MGAKDFGFNGNTARREGRVDKMEGRWKVLSGKVGYLSSEVKDGFEGL
jgi:hypothetical protein